MSGRLSFFLPPSFFRLQASCHSTLKSKALYNFICILYFILKIETLKNLHCPLYISHEMEMFLWAHAVQIKTIRQMINI